MTFVCLAQFYPRGKVFSHESALGNYPTHKLFELLRIENRTPEKPPRAYSDYEVRIVGDIPENVALQKLD